MLGETVTHTAGDVLLEMRAVPSNGHFSFTDIGPDHLVAGIVIDNEFSELRRLDGRYLSTEAAGGITGRVFGIYCARGDLLVRSFSYSGADDPALFSVNAPSDASSGTA